ncbi:hypothetical protein IJH27_00925 [Candidatus Saccharibacteria bacterium]|nr:hypothetical protein [Candidatus Saccharibacteria bacterium]
MKRHIFLTFLFSIFLSLVFIKADNAFADLGARSCVSGRRETTYSSDYTCAISDSGLSGGRTCGGSYCHIYFDVSVGEKVRMTFSHNAFSTSYRANMGGEDTNVAIGREVIYNGLHDRWGGTYYLDGYYDISYPESYELSDNLIGNYEGGTWDWFDDASSFDSFPYRVKDRKYTDGSSERYISRGIYDITFHKSGEYYFCQTVAWALPYDYERQPLTEVCSVVNVSDSGGYDPDPYDPDPYDPPYDPDPPYYPPNEPDTHESEFTAFVGLGNSDGTLTCPPGNTCSGDGIHTSYWVDVELYFRRTDFNYDVDAWTWYYPKIGIDSGYWNWEYLSDGTIDMDARDDNYRNPEIMYYKVDVPVGETVKLCAEMDYDYYAEWEYYSGGWWPIDRRETTTDKACIYIDNPVNDYTANFINASSGVYIDSSTSTSAWDYSLYGSSATAKPAKDSNGNLTTPTDKLKLNFSHYLQRQNSESPAFTISNIVSKWKIQESYNGGVTWSDTGYSSETTPTFPGLTDSKLLKSMTVEFSPKNTGTSTIYCQRIVYSPQTRYYASGGKDFEGSSTSSSACFTINYPKYEWAYADNYTDHNITVTGETTGVTATGAVRNASGVYIATEPSVSLGFDHRLTRTDSGFNEALLVSGKNYSLCSHPTRSTCYFYPNRLGSMYDSVYGTPRAKVSTSLSVEETITENGEQKSKKNISPAGTAGSSLSVDLTNSNYANYTSSSSNSWSSSATRGRTTTSLNTNTVASAYSLLAGETKTITQQGTNTYKNYAVHYRDTFLKGTLSGTVIRSEYDRTELVASSKYTTNLANPTSTTNNSNTFSAYSATVHRDYNFNIVDISPATSGPSFITSSTDPVSATFNVAVERDNGWSDGITRNFITDLNSKVYLVTYVIDENANTEDATRITSGDTISGSDFCYLVRSRGALNCTQTDKDSGGDDYAFGGYNSNKVYTDSSYSTGINIPNISVPTLSVGQKFCIAVGVYPVRSSSSTTGRLSTSTCMTTVKRPNVQVYGGSVGSNGGVKGSITTVKNGDNSYRFSSWTDLAIIAKGEVNGFSSGSAISANRVFTDKASELCDISPLTIANSQCEANSADTLGDSGIDLSTTLYDSLVSRYENVATTIKTQTIDSSPSVTNGEATVIFNDSSDPLIISSNIEVPDGGYDSNNLPPQIFIISNGDVLINDNVEKIDAIIVSRGKVDTCGNVAIADLNSAVCNQILQINGVVVANSVNLRRTAGGDYAIDSNISGNVASPAEIINYATSVYLFGANSSGKDGDLYITYQKSLPPRY